MIIEFILLLVAHAAAGIFSSTLKYSKKTTHIIWGTWVVLQTALLFYTEFVLTNWALQFFFGFVLSLVGQYVIFFVTTKGKLAQRIFTMLTYSIFFCIVMSLVAMVNGSFGELHWILIALIRAALLFAIVFYFLRYSFGLMYKEEQITDEEKASTKRSDIEKCLSAGVVPDVLEGRVTVEIVDETETLNNVGEGNSVRERKIKSGVFVRNIEENYVICPMGQVLRQKSINRGKIRYANKAACKKCLNPYTIAEYKTVDYKPEQREIKQKNGASISKKDVKNIKRVIVCFKPDEKTAPRRILCK